MLVVAETDSTNLLARRIAAEYEDERQNLPRAYLLAWEQTAGRGREKRVWTSPPGKGVYATLLTWVGNIEHLSTLPLLAGVAICRGLAPLLGDPASARLKWPNDVMVAGKKIGGLLIEAALRTDEGAIVMLGFGVNHSHREEDLPIAAATSLELEGGTATLPELATSLIGSLEAELAHLGDAAYAVAAYRDLSIHTVGDRMVCRVGERTVAGTFLGFDKTGGLRLATVSPPGSVPAGSLPLEEITISAGEVIQ